jgi:hypothetical protein
MNMLEKGATAVILPECGGARAPEGRERGSETVPFKETILNVSEKEVSADSDVSFVF